MSYRERSSDLARDRRFRQILILKNHPGIFYRHPHSHILAMPVIPRRIDEEIWGTLDYFKRKERCIFCDIIQEEITLGKRLILETPHFLSFCPFASRSPFECRIYPKNHQASYHLIGDSEIYELAQVVKHVLARLYYGLNNPDYNYFIRSAPIGDHDTRHLHWYMVIVPKISIPAGFEIGTGIYINTVSPEEAAQYLNSLKF